MIMRRSYVLAVFAAALAACGGSSDNSASSVCSKGASVANSLPAKFAPCGAPPAIDIPQGATCEAKLAACTSADRDTLNSLLDCLNAVPTCSVATSQQFQSQVLACAGQTSTLSDACKTALDL